MRGKKESKLYLSMGILFHCHINQQYGYLIKQLTVKSIFADLDCRCLSWIIRKIWKLCLRGTLMKNGGQQNRRVPEYRSERNETGFKLLLLLLCIWCLTNVFVMFQKEHVLNSKHVQRTMLQLMRNTYTQINNGKKTANCLLCRI